MPELRRLGVHAPVILVGTKNDLGKQREQELSTVRSSLLALQKSARVGLLSLSVCIGIVIIASGCMSHRPVPGDQSASFSCAASRWTGGTANNEAVQGD